MKVFLTMIMCSAFQGICLNPHTMPTYYDSYYDCLVAGEEATKKQKELEEKKLTRMKFILSLIVNEKVNESRRRKEIPVKFIGGNLRILSRESLLRVNLFKAIDEMRKDIKELKTFMNFGKGTAAVINL